MNRADWELAVLLGAIHFTFHLYVRLIPPLIPVLAIRFDYPLWMLGMLVTAFFVGSSAGILPMGVVSDRYDRRASLTAALAVGGGGYVVFAFADRLGVTLPAVRLGGEFVGGPFLVMLAGMVVAGLGTSAHVPVSIPLITANAEPENKGKVLGAWGAGSKLGDAAAPAAVGVLLLVADWRAILLGFGGLGIALAGVLFAVLSFDRFETQPAGRSRASSGTPPWRADRRRFLYPVVVLMGYYAAYNVTVQGAVTFIPTFITEVYGYTLTVADVAFAPESFADFALATLLIAAAVSRLVGGALTDRIDHRSLLVVSLGVAAVALFGFAALPLSPLALVAVLVVFGAAVYGNSPARDALISDLSPAEHEGRTFSYLLTSARVFAAASPVAIGVIAEWVGLRTGFAVLAAATFVAMGAVALLFSPRVYDARPAGSAADP